MCGAHLANWPAGTNSQRKLPAADPKFTEFPAEHVVESHIGVKDHSDSRFFSILLGPIPDRTELDPAESTAAAFALDTFPTTGENRVAVARARDDPRPPKPVYDFPRSCLLSE